MLFNFKTNNFFTRSKYSYTLFTFIIILLTAFVSYSVIINHLKEEVTQSNILLLNQKQQRIDSKLASIEGSINNLLMNSTVKAFMYNSPATEYERYKIHESLQQDIISLCLVHQGIESIYLYSERSNKILTNSTCTSSSNFIDMSWKAQLSGNYDHNTLYSTRKIKENTTLQNEFDVITLIKAYPLPNTYSDSAIVVNLDEDLLYKSIEDINSASENQLIVVDKDGRILMHKNKLKLYTYAHNLPFYNKVIENNSGNLTCNIDGVKSTVFYTTSPTTGWKYINITPVSPISDTLMNVMQALSIIVILLILLATVSMRYLNRWVDKPIYGFVNNIADKIRQSSIDKNLAHSESFMNFDNLEEVFSDILDVNKKIKSQMNKSMPAIKWQLVTDILLGNKTNFIELKEYFDMLNVDLYQSNYLVMIADLDKKPNPTNEKNEQSIDLYLGALCKQSEEYIKEVCKGVSIVQSDGRVVMIISYDKNCDYQTTAVSIAELLKNFMLSYFDITITVAIGTPCIELKEVQESFRLAMNALQYKIVMGYGSVILANDLQILDQRGIYQLLSMIDELEESIRSCNLAEIDGFLDTMFYEISQQTLPYDSIIQIATQILMHTIRVTVDFGLTIDVINDKFGDMYSKLYNLEKLEDIKNYINNVLKYACDMISSQKAPKGSHELIEQIVAYLDENYMHPNISLTFIAEKFYISRQHLSKIFKDVTNIGFFDYLINLRMEHSKKMLSGSDEKINKIAESVGYTNVHSFIKIFKKITGMTPTQYRNVHRKS